MSSAITAAVALSVTAAMQIDQAQRAKKAQNDQENRVKDEQARITEEVNAQKKKKEISDIQASNKALSLRNQASGTANLPGVLGVGSLPTLNTSDLDTPLGQ